MVATRPNGVKLAVGVGRVFRLLEMEVIMMPDGLASWGGFTYERPELPYLNGPLGATYGG